MKRSSPILLLFLILVLTISAFPQVATGTPPFSSLGGGPFDVVNLGNLNVHFAIPVFHRNGRGTPFYYNLTYDSSIWTPPSSGGTTWTPAGSWGWQSQTSAVTGDVPPPKKQTSTCTWYDGLGHAHTQTYYIWTYSGFVDPLGTFHSVTLILISGSGQCNEDQSLDTETTNDGSGWTVTVPTGKVTSRNGVTYVVPVGGSGAGSVTDNNGNEITTTDGITFYDSLSSQSPVLTISGSVPTVNYTYTSPAGSVKYVMNYSAYNIKTNFGCSGISEYTANGAYLVSSITLPDQSNYSLTYEPTVGSSGYVTGRLATVTLPTGGEIQYGYGNTGTHNTIECVDGSAATLTRTLSGGSWQYSRTGSGTSWTTTLSDPSNNQTVINFSKDSASHNPTQNFYETQRQVYQGTATGSPLLTLLTCYNGSFTGAGCATAAVGSGISQIDVFRTVPTATSTKTSLSETSFGFYGLRTNHAEWNYGLTAGQAPPTGWNSLLLSYTTYLYATLTNGIYDHPSQVTLKDGQGNIKSQLTYTYDQGTLATSGAPQLAPVTGSRGNLTTLTTLTSGTSTVTQTFTYYDSGNVNTATDVNGAVTTYKYLTDSCGYAFPTEIDLPISGLIQYQDWNCDGAVLNWSKDLNLNKTAYTYGDANFWRVTQVTPPIGSTSYSYSTGPTWTVTATTATDATHSVAVTNSLDGFGRTSAVSTSDPNSTTGYSQVLTTYNSLGQVSSVSNPYYTTSDQTYGLTSYQYDALGRTTKITNPDKSFRSYTYTAGATKAVDEAEVTRVYQTDGLGRLVSVCEVTSKTQQGSAGTPASCNQDINLTGFLTSYTYDPLGNPLSVTQPGVGSRTYQYDGLSRLTQEVNPESGTTSYTYDAAGQQGDLYQRTRPAPNQTGSTCPGNCVTTTYTFDPLHRLTYQSYNDTSATIPTPAVSFGYDEANVWGTVTSNYKGRLTHASRAGSAGMASVFSYDPMGRMNFGFQCDPFDCGTAAVEYWYTYNYLGVPTSEKMGNDTTETNYITYTHTLDANGRLLKETSSLVDATHPATLYTATSYNALGEIVSDTLGNGISRAFTYDNRGRFLNHVDTLGGTTVFGTYAWYSTNNDVAGTSTSAEGTWEFTYDDLNRLSAACQPSATCKSNPSTATAAFNYAYDPVGNRWSQTIPPTCSGCTGPQPQYNFDPNNHITTSSITYDAAGNVKNDGTYAYTYDAENRLITVGGGSQAYFYDAFGRQSQTIYGGNTYSMIFGLNGRTEVEFIGNTWMLGELYAGSVGPSLGNYSYNKTYFAHNDQVGTRRRYTDQTGTVADTCTSLPFGDGSSCSGSAPPASITAFTGQDWDPATNLTRFPARNYSAQQGRWMHPDPAGLAAVDPSNPQTWNRYAYVANNPTTFNDPQGLLLAACYADYYCDLLGDAQNSPGGGDGGGGGFNFSFEGGWDPCSSDFMLCGSLSTSPTQAIQSLWADALGLPSGLNCPVVGGISNLLCGGVSPIEDWKGSYADCVKQAGEDFSLQNALRSFSPKWGDSWFASTFLGNEYSDYIGYAQHLSSRNSKGVWNDFVQYVESKDVEALERESVKKIVETVNPYNLGAVVVSAGVLCPVTYEGK